MEVPAEPDNVAVPKEVPPKVNATLPVGVTLLAADFTVTVSVAWLFSVMLEGLAMTVVLVPTWPLPH